MVFCCLAKKLDTISDLNKLYTRKTVSYLKVFSGSFEDAVLEGKDLQGIDGEVCVNNGVGLKYAGRSDPL